VFFAGLGVDCFELGVGRFKDDLTTGRVPLFDAKESTAETRYVKDIVHKYIAAY
jgi:hypothetical protein